MPPMGGKSKAKARDGRQSPSRNTTPSSNISIPISNSGPLTTVYLDIPTENLIIPTNTNYDDILERHGGGGGIPDPKLLEIMANDLNVLSQLADTRGQACDGAMRELSKRRKEKREEERAREQANREAEEKESLKRAAEDEDEARGRKGAKLKKRKERSNVREERPLTHGAHGLARQDGSDLPAKGTLSTATISFLQFSTSNLACTSYCRFELYCSISSLFSLFLALISAFIMTLSAWLSGRGVGLQK